jgi:hypothetical protein
VIERGNLRDGQINIGRIGIGHRLDDDGGAAAHHDAADVHTDRRTAIEGGGEISGHRRRLSGQEIRL